MIGPPRQASVARVIDVVSGFGERPNDLRRDVLVE
jgi:hypothetical protein